MSSLDASSALPFDTEAVICPRFMPNYAATFYLGLQRFVHADRIRYDREGYSAQRLQGVRGFSLVLRSGSRSLKMHFDSHDPKELDLEMLRWCDVYGKSNFEASAIPENERHKVLPVGPSFALRIWDTPATMQHAMSTLAALGRPSPRFAWHHLHLYRLQLTRGFSYWYTPGPSDPDYVFFTAWAWAKHTDVNPPRAEFVRIAQTMPGLYFDGGFAPRRRGALPGLGDVTAPKKYRFFDYLTRMKRSCVAFNTPAVHDCFGWKLGEFLALGKAIISLPLTRRLPEPLVHGEHVHFVSGEPAETREALERLRSDHDYRLKLEKNARAYFERYLRPETVFERALRHAGWLAQGNPARTLGDG